MCFAILFRLFNFFEIPNDIEVFLMNIVFIFELKVVYVGWCITFKRHVQYYFVQNLNLNGKRFDSNFPRGENSTCFLRSAE